MVCHVLEILESCERNNTHTHRQNRNMLLQVFDPRGARALKSPSTQEASIIGIMGISFHNLCSKCKRPAPVPILSCGINQKSRTGRPMMLMMASKKLPGLLGNARNTSKKQAQDWGDRLVPSKWSVEGRI